MTRRILIILTTFCSLQGLLAQEPSLAPTPSPAATATASPTPNAKPWKPFGYVSAQRSITQEAEKDPASCHSPASPTCTEVGETHHAWEAMTGFGWEKSFERSQIKSTWGVEGANEPMRFTGVWDLGAIWTHPSFQHADSIAQWHHGLEGHWTKEPQTKWGLRQTRAWAVLSLGIRQSDPAPLWSVRALGFWERKVDRKSPAESRVVGPVPGKWDLASALELQSQTAFLNTFRGTWTLTGGRIPFQFASEWDSRTRLYADFTGQLTWMTPLEGHSLKGLVKGGWGLDAHPLGTLRFDSLSCDLSGDICQPQVQTHEENTVWWQLLAEWELPLQWALFLDFSAVESRSTIPEDGGSRTATRLGLRWNLGPEDGLPSGVFGLPTWTQR